jgi:ABC-2 type transport system permease protein
MKAFITLCKTELKLSLRGMDMLIFALCLPVAVMVILGLIYGDRPAFEGAGYSFLAQSFGAVSTIAINAGGAMGLPLLVSDYRQKKILKRFRVTPASPGLILAVHVAIYTLYALASLALVYLTAALGFGYRMAGSWAGFAGSFLLIMFSLFSLGMMVGGVAKSPKQAGIIASLLFFPMLLFSGTTLPYEVMPTAMQRVADVLPLTQGVKLLKAASLGLPLEGVLLPILAMVTLAILCVGVSLRCFRWE